MNSSYRLNRKVSIQYNAQPERTDTDGNTFPDWKPITNATAWVEKTSRVGKYLFQAAAEQSLTDMIFITHYREDITSTMRIIDGVETYEIRVPPVDLDGHRLWLIIQGVRVLTNGS